MHKTGILHAEIEILGHAHFSLVLIDVIMSPACEEYCMNLHQIKFDLQVQWVKHCMKDR